MNLDDAEQLARRKMREHCLTNNGWTLKWDRALHRYGQTNVSQKTISLSRPLTEANSVEHVTDTILHEIAHAIVGGNHGHDDVWRREARVLGADPSRESAGISAKVQTKYTGVCPACGKTSQGMRKMKRPYSCGKCDPLKFNPAFELKWTKNY
jgi:predicted SprT family Zn-dependent metalloprotease